jgi:hypothetical protein
MLLLCACTNQASVLFKVRSHCWNFMRVELCDVVRDLLGREDEVVDGVWWRNDHGA